MMSGFGFKEHNFVHNIDQRNNERDNLIFSIDLAPKTIYVTILFLTGLPKLDFVRKFEKPQKKISLNLMTMKSQFFQKFLFCWWKSTNKKPKKRRFG